MRYDLVGQDCVLEQLFRVLSIQSRGLSVAPIVVLLCGPSGHGKSLLARKCTLFWLRLVDIAWMRRLTMSCCHLLVGFLLDVPTHTVNVTTLKSTHDLWQSHSMSPYEVCAAIVLLTDRCTHPE